MATSLYNVRYKFCKGSHSSGVCCGAGELAGELAEELAYGLFLARWFHKIIPGPEVLFSICVG